MGLDHVTRLAVSVETQVLPPQGSPLSPKKPGRLAGTCPHALTAPPACKASGGTEISLSQKQQIQQLRLLQETQICTGLISPGLYHHAKNRSYYALSGGQGPILSGVGEMIPQPQGGQTPPSPNTHIAGILTALPRKAVPSQDRPLPGYPDCQRTKALPETEQGLDPTGKAVTGATSRLA